MQYLALYGDDRGSVAAVYRDGRIAAAARGPPLTYDAAAGSGFLEALTTLWRGIGSLRGFERLAISLSGVPRNREEIMNTAARVFGARRVAALSQVHAFYYAATCGGDGVIVASDTGSFAYGVYRGVKAGTGGWGWLFDDEGGAYWVAREGLRRAFLYIDGRSRDGRHLASKLLDRLGAPDPLSAVRKLYAEYREPGRLAMLAPDVCEAAEEGDAAALDVVREASFHLASLAETVYKRLGFPKTPVYAVGWFMGRCKLLREETSALLMSLGIFMRPVEVEPLTGCLAYLLSREGGVDCKELSQMVGEALKGGESGA